MQRLTGQLKLHFQLHIPLTGFNILNLSIMLTSLQPLDFFVPKGGCYEEFAHTSLFHKSMEINQ